MEGYRWRHSELTGWWVIVFKTHFQKTVVFSARVPKNIVIKTFPRTSFEVQRYEGMKDCPSWCSGHCWQLDHRLFDGKEVSCDALQRVGDLEG